MVTMADVAREAGVSTATVSYVLSGSKLISEPTAAKVRAAIGRLGYAVNQTARNLASSRTGTIGVVVPSYKAAGFSLSLSSFLCDYATNANARGFDTLLLTDAYDEMTTLRKAVAMKKVDGVILMDAEADDPRLPVLEEAGVPAVLTGAMNREAKGVDCVYTDFARAADETVECLYSHGHRDVVLVPDAQRLADRGVQYVTMFGAEARRAAADRGMTLHVLSDADPDGGRGAVGQALGRFPDATAMIIHNDAASIGAPQVFQGLGVVVPRDLSVISIVPARLAESLCMPYTSVRADSRVLAKTAVDLLADRIADPSRPAESKLVHAPFVDLGTVINRS